ncbi:Hypothetical protein A7982_01428 [Minicystis rosea]|nr:Hypothetical protein A7982_01428 [Minicystis rosea]
MLQPSCDPCRENGAFHPRLAELLVQTFEAVEVQRMALPDGPVMQAEVTIDDSLVMIMAPRSGAAPMPCSLGIYVDDVDATYQNARLEARAGSRSRRTSSTGIGPRGSRTPLEISGRFTP